MNRRDEQISFDAIGERIAPEVPRFVVYPGKAWNEAGTFIVELLNSDPRAKKSWDGLSAGEQRDFVLFVASAKKPETRARRARRLPDAKRFL